MGFDTETGLKPRWRGMRKFRQHVLGEYFIHPEIGARTASDEDGKMKVRRTAYIAERGAAKCRICGAAR